jgi:hypothetical protein
MITNQIKKSKMNKLTLKQAIEQLTSMQNNANVLNASLYSVDDVLNILNSIQEPKTLSPSWQEDLTQGIRDMIENEFSEMVDYDDIEFDLNQREISASSVGYDSREIRNVVTHWVDINAGDILLAHLEEEEQITDEETDEDDNCN